MRRLNITDLKQPDGDAAAVLSMFNDYVDGLTGGAKMGTVDAVVSAALLPVKVKSPVANPVSVFVGKATLPDGDPSGVGLSIDWRLQDGQIVVINAYGMASGATYRLTLAVMGA
jgi:hypothetical protein